MKGIFTLDWGSVADAVLTAVGAAILTALYGVVTTSGFDAFATNWVLVGHNMVNLSLVAGVVVLAKDFLSTTSGSLLGITPPNSTTTSK